MSRKQRRQKQRRNIQVLAASQCPDCDSEVNMIEVEPGRYRGQVAHDETCPWFADLKARGGFGIRVL